MFLRRAKSAVFHERELDEKHCPSPQSLGAEDLTHPFLLGALGSAHHACSSCGHCSGYASLSPLG